MIRCIPILWLSAAAAAHAAGPEFESATETPSGDRPAPTQAPVGERREAPAADPAPAPDPEAATRPRDATTIDPALGAALNGQPAAAGAAPAPRRRPVRLPDITLRARVFVGDREPAAVIDVDDSLFVIRGGSAFSVAERGGGSVLIEVMEFGRDGIRLAVGDQGDELVLQ